MGSIDPIPSVVQLIPKSYEQQVALGPLSESEACSLVARRRGAQYSHTDLDRQVLLYASWRQGDDVGFKEVAVGKHLRCFRKSTGVKGVHLVALTHLFHYKIFLVLLLQHQAAQGGAPWALGWPVGVSLAGEVFKATKDQAKVSSTERAWSFFGGHCTENSTSFTDS